MTKQNASHQHLHTDCSESSPSTIEVVIGYLQKGFSVIPLKAGTKEPALPSWKEYQTRQPTLEEVTNWWQSNPEANVGLVCGKESDAIVLDVDDPEKFEDALKNLGWEIPVTAMVKTKRGYHIYFRYPKGYIVRRYYCEGFGAELRGDGCYVVAPPSVVNGHKYKWMCDGDRELSVFTAELAEPPIELLEAFSVPKETDQTASTTVIATPQNNNGNRSKAHLISAIVALLQSHWVEGQRHDLSLYLAGWLRKVGWEWEEVEELLKAITKDAKDDELHDRLRAIRDTFTKNKDEIAGVSRLKEILSEDIFKKLAALIGDNHDDDWFRDFEMHVDVLTSPVKLGDLIAEKMKDRLRWVEAWSWVWWDGKRWVKNASEALIEKEATDLIFNHFIALAQKSTSPETKRVYIDCARRCLDNSRIKKALERVKGCLLASPDEFDRDDYLLNCQNGVVDLRTGELLPHDPKFFITKIAHASYNPKQPTPTWDKFLQDVFCGDDELIAFIYRTLGYALTGTTKENKAFIAYGSGANGKSTLFNTVLRILGDYGKAIPAETMLQSGYGDGHPTKLAALYGIRMGFMSETEEDKCLNERRFKAVTGSDFVSARFLYHDYFTFEVKAKIFLAVNHKPIITDTTEAMWRRIILIPFRAFFSEKQADKDMPNKLWAERDGILAKLVAGCLEWQQIGLNPPKVVREATEEYRNDMDKLAEWLKECCIYDHKAATPFANLYASYCQWCAEHDEEPISKQKFASKLNEKNFSAVTIKINGRSIKARKGLRLRSEIDDHDSDEGGGQLLPSSENSSKPCQIDNDNYEMISTNEENGYCGYRGYRIFDKNPDVTLYCDDFPKNAVTAVTSVTDQQEEITEKLRNFNKLCIKQCTDSEISDAVTASISKIDKIANKESKLCNCFNRCNPVFRKNSLMKSPLQEFP